MGVLKEIFSRGKNVDGNIVDYLLPEDISLAVDYKEELHPRDATGKWAKKDYDFVTSDDAAVMIAEQGLTKNDVASLSGALGIGERVYIAEFDGELSVNVEYEDYSSTRIINIGTKTILNEGLDVEPFKRGQGLGTKILYSQVQAAKEHGFNEIKTNAARSSVMNGYYTWPRLGFDGRLSQMHQLADTMQKYAADRGWKTMHDVMSTKAGRDWWKAEGESVDVTFDLHDKKSLHVLTAARRAHEPDALALSSTFDEEKHPRDSEGQFAETETRNVHNQQFVYEKIREAVKDRPGRATHGNTGTNAFFIYDNGDIKAWDDKSRKELRGGHMVHSHSGENASTLVKAEDFQPHNSEDIKILLDGMKDGSKTASTIIMWDGRSETLRLDPDATAAQKKALGKLSKPKLKLLVDSTYDESAVQYREHKKLRHDYEREKVAKFAKDYGLLYTFANWKTGETLTKV